MGETEPNIIYATYYQNVLVIYKKKEWLAGLLIYSWYITKI